MDRGWTVGGWRNLLHCVETAPETIGGTSRTMGTRTCLSAVRNDDWRHSPVVLTSPLCVRSFEKPLVLQICRLLRGFTHPGTYFADNEDQSGGEIALYR